jgi:hypothetical protein
LPSPHAAVDPARGERLVAEKCEGCHSSKVPGETGTIYLRRNHKVTSLDKLRAQVSRCNNGMSLGLMPDEEEDVTAFLNERYYKFPAK